MAEQYSVVYTYHIVFIHSSVDGHFHSSHVLAIVNGAGVHTGIHLSFGIIVLNRVGLLNHMARLFLAFFFSFFFLAIVNGAAVHTGIHVSFGIIVLNGVGLLSPRSGTAQSHGKAVFSFLSTLHTVFPGGCTRVHSHEQCRRVLFSARPIQDLLFVDS